MRGAGRIMRISAEPAKYQVLPESHAWPILRNSSRVQKGDSMSKEMLLVGSKAKAALKEHDVNVGGDALDGLNEILHHAIEQAAKRASQNGRKTVRSHDFIC